MTNKLEILNKNNLLIKSSYDLNLVQNRFYLTILYTMQREGIDYSCKIKGSQLARLSSKKVHTTPKGIYNILHSLRRKSIELHEIKDSRDVLYNCGIINKFKYDKDTDTYEIFLDGEIYDLLINYYKLNNGYTPLNVGILVGLNSYYAQRLYELLRMESWKGREITYTVEYLRDCFQLGSRYSQYSDFKKRTILPAIKVLNETQKFHIDYKEIKSNRKVVALVFIVDDLEPREYFSIVQEAGIPLKSEVPELKDTKKDQLEEPVIKDMIETDKDEPSEPVVEEVKEAKKVIDSKPISATENSAPRQTKGKSVNIADAVDFSLWSRPSQLSLNRKLKGYDFADEIVVDAYYEASTIVMDKDGVEVLSKRQENLFIKIFKEYIEKARAKQLDDFYSDIENELLWEKV